jgi:cytochrome c oxidase cbb3-type subunit 3
MRLAKNTFSQYCQSCHDKDGKGQTNFPNLTDQAWFWGGSEGGANYISYTLFF